MKDGNYFFHNSAENVKKQVNDLREVFVLASNVFGKDWEEGSVWENLETLLEDWKNFNYQDIGKELETNFSCVILDQISWDKLFQLRDGLRFLEGLPAIQVERQNGQELGETVKWQEWEKLDLNQSKTGKWPKKFFYANKEASNQVSDALQKLSDVYVEFKLEFQIVASVLGYFRPSDSIIDVGGLRKAMLFLESDDTRGVDQTEVLNRVLRFLGDSFFSVDVEVREWSLDFIASSPLNKDIYANKSVLILVIVCFYIASRDFSDLAEVDRLSILDMYAWLILSFGISLRRVMEKDLSDQPFINYYQFFSGLYAKAIFDGNSTIALGDGFVKTSKFLKDFLVSADGKELDGFRQVSFVDDKIKQYQWPGATKFLLLELINIYLHLREMDLVDYRAWLSDGGIKPYPYNWKMVLQKDLTEEEKAEIKRHFQLLHMPIKLKMELILAIRSLPWKEEPFLTRILVLSDLFSSVYGYPYSPLIYFSEQEGELDLNRDLPDFWYKYNLLISINKEVEEILK